MPDLAGLLTDALLDAALDLVRLSEESDRAEEESADPALDGILETAAAAGVALSDEVVSRIKALFRKPRPMGELFAEAEALLRDAEPLLARTVADAMVAAWLHAGREAARGLPPGPEAPPPSPAETSELPPAPPQPPVPLPAPEESGPLVRFPVTEEAAADLASRQVLTRADFDRLTGDARARAFTVARVSSEDALTRLRDALHQDVANGGTLREFAGKVEEVLGEGGLSPGHLENVYRTNVGQAYKAGQQAVLDHPLVFDEFPYVAYEGVHDSRRRATHAWFQTGGLDGTNVYRRDDVTIRRFWAPWEWQCRCTMVPLTLQDAAARGVREAREWLETGRPPAAPEWVAPPPFDPPPGFAR